MPTHNFFGSLIATCTLLSPLSAEEKKYYTAEWTALKNYQVPEWYRDGKFGIWTHWGVYSVPAYRGEHAAEWYPRWMYMDPGKKPFDAYKKQGEAIMDHHRKTYGDPSSFGYHDLALQWKAENWDPDSWAQLAIDSGAKFFTITGMHHDGFALYDSDFTEWDSVDKGPKRDLVGDLEKSIRKRGLKFGISNHFAFNRSYYNYFFQNGHDKIFETRPELKQLYSSGRMDDEYFTRWWNITTEMVRKYSPDLYYFDWGWDGKAWKNEWPEFFSYYYNHAIRSGMGTLGNPDVLVNYKQVPAAHGSGVYDLERASMRDVQDYVWQTDTSVSDYSWGYSDNDTFKSPAALISMLVDIVSKNGALMLNFGPKADGTVPAEVMTRLQAMGTWLKSNGEAVYATRPWVVAEEGPTEFSGNHKRVAGGPYDVRYTRSKDSTKVYATVFGLPADGQLILQSTKVSGESSKGAVTMLSNKKSIPFSVNTEKQIVLDLSGITAKNAGCEHAYAFCIEGFDMTGVNRPPLDLAKFYLTKVGSYKKAQVSESLHLSDVMPVIERAHKGSKRDTNYHGKPILIDGKGYDRGLMVCPAGKDGVGYFFIDMKQLPKVKGFKADIGIEDAVTSRGSSAFIVEALVDGNWQRLYESKVLTFKDTAESIDVAIPANATHLTLITTDGKNGGAADHAIWAGAEFY